MSVATAIHRPVAIFREEQNFGWWVYALLAVMAGIGVVAAFWMRPDEPPTNPTSIHFEIPLALAIGLILPSVLIMGVLRMTTEVIPTDVRVWFGWFPTYRRDIAISEIVMLEVVRYRPIRECGGWGIRTGPDGEKVLNARGDRGVRLRLRDGTRILIGSQRPDELARAIEEARHQAS